MATLYFLVLPWSAYTHCRCRMEKIRCVGRKSGLAASEQSSLMCNTHEGSFEPSHFILMPIHHNAIAISKCGNSSTTSRHLGLAYQLSSAAIGIQQPTTPAVLSIPFLAILDVCRWAFDMWSRTIIHTRSVGSSA